ncbi:hypothetical protein M501DRAFT_238888 [Patellaria atrata CBS 101060]|uniref:Uncharacterized protein n=1 Tax=Patellaria atrata CBS 101060 TaxID=1346257 RepID=A0A9P4VQD5_9PEZI|nr:hypothetical protein M501DRAFT_238888 [Patellaria atrata CBS 101060]
MLEMTCRCSNTGGTVGRRVGEIQHWRSDRKEVKSGITRSSRSSIQGLSCIASSLFAPFCCEMVKNANDEGGIYCFRIEGLVGIAAWSQELRTQRTGGSSHEQLARRPIDPIVFTSYRPSSLYEHIAAPAFTRITTTGCTQSPGFIGSSQPPGYH